MEIANNLYKDCVHREQKNWFLCRGTTNFRNSSGKDIGNTGIKKTKGVEKFKARMLQHNTLTMKYIKILMLHKWKKRGWKRCILYIKNQR